MRAISRSLLAFLLALVSAPGLHPSAQEAAGLVLPPPLEWSTERDYANMQRQLGITALRPGPSGRNDAPNPANYDESVANPLPDWPDPLILDDGTPVTTAVVWWERRRPEIVAAFEREVLGRVPDVVPGVRWSVGASATGTLAGRPVTGRQLTGRVDNASYPLIEVTIDLELVVPADLDRPAPLVIMFRAGTLEQALGREPSPRPQPPPDYPPATEQLIAAGWGFAFLDPRKVQADSGAGLTRGIIGLVNAGQARKPDDWGALRAWAWAASRALDYLETDGSVDATRVGIEGVSRYGKAALVAMSFDTRFAVALIGSSGAGGVSPYRRNFGELVETLTGAGEYHWMAGNFLKYGTAESVFGEMNAGDLPVDAHSLLALAAPRPVFVSYGIPEKGDSLWLDQQGSYMTTVAAGRVYRLVGATDLGTNEDYRSATKPPVNRGLLDGALAWRQHDGGHTDGPNWVHFIPWAERELGLTRDWPTARARRRTDLNSEIAHAELVQKAQTGTVDVYFVGDSITRRWGALDYPELLANWNANFFGWNAGNFAWGGDRTQNMLWRLDNGELDGVEPKVFVVQAGTNNLGDFENEETRVEAVTAGIRAIMERCRERAPASVIVLTGLFPRNDRPELNSSIASINDRLATYADGASIRYVDVNERLSGRDGELLGAMTSDGLHLSGSAYQVWADALGPVLTEILGPPAERDRAPPPTGDPGAR
jgi:lysophospholipase L1-like esterase